jgi:hypothetical protein
MKTIDNCCFNRDRDGSSNQEKNERTRKHWQEKLESAKDKQQALISKESTLQYVNVMDRYGRFLTLQQLCDQYGPR